MFQRDSHLENTKRHWSRWSKAFKNNWIISNMKALNGNEKSILYLNMIIEKLNQNNQPAIYTKISVVWSYSQLISRVQHNQRVHWTSPTELVFQIVYASSHSNWFQPPKEVAILVVIYHPDHSISYTTYFLQSLKHK